jgi:hypothetical protein
LPLFRASRALACPSCFSAGNPRVLETYYLTALLLSILPLAILGTIGGWLYVRSRRGSLDER